MQIKLKVLTTGELCHKPALKWTPVSKMAVNQTVYNKIILTTLEKV